MSCNPGCAGYPKFVIESFSNAALSTIISIFVFLEIRRCPSSTSQSNVPGLSLPSRHRKRSNMFPGEAASGTSSPHGADNANPMVQEDSWPRGWRDCVLRKVRMGKNILLRSKTRDDGIWDYEVETQEETSIGSGSFDPSAAGRPSSDVSWLDMFWGFIHGIACWPPLRVSSAWVSVDDDVSCGFSLPSVKVLFCTWRCCLDCLARGGLVVTWVALPAASSAAGLGARLVCPDISGHIVLPVSPLLTCSFSLLGLAA